MPETIALIDDIIPGDMDKYLEARKRNSSIIRVKVGAKDGLAESQKITGNSIHYPSRNRRSRRNSSLRSFRRIELNRAVETV